MFEFRKGTKIVKSRKNIPYLFETQSKRDEDLFLEKQRQKFWKSRSDEGGNAELEEDSSDDGIVWEDFDDNEADEDSKSVRFDINKQDDDPVNDTDASKLIATTTGTKRKHSFDDSKKTMPFKRIKHNSETINNDTTKNQFEIKEHLSDKKNVKVESGSSVSSVGDSSSDDSSTEEREDENDDDDYEKMSSVGDSSSDDSSTEDSSTEESVSNREDESDDDDYEGPVIGNLNLSKLPQQSPPPQKKRARFIRERDEDSSDDSRVDI